MEPQQSIQPSEGRRPYTFDRVVRMIIATIITVAAIWLVDRLSGVLLPFLVAWLIAYILEPFVQWNRRLFRLKGRIMAITLTLVEATLLFSALCVVFVPWIMSEIKQMSAIMTRYAESQHTVIPFVPDEVHKFLRDNIDFQALAGQISSQDVQEIGKWALNTVTGGFDFLLGAFSWLIVVLYVVFIMLDYDKLIDGFHNLVPPKARTVVFGVFDDVTYSMNHYFRGQALVSLCVGILFAIGFAIIGLPLGVVLGLFIGLLNMVPYLQLISIVPTTLLCLVYSVSGGSGFWVVWGECMLVYCVCQVIQDFFLTPKIMGKFMGLNPAVILLALSIWGSLLGLIGLIIALPLTTIVLAYYKRYVIARGEAREALASITETEE